MCKFNPKNESRRMDPCIIKLIEFIKVKGGKIQPIASCCGHGKYPMTIVVRNDLGHIWELLSHKAIWRKKRFYKRDKQGYYYIPEEVHNLNQRGTDNEPE